MNSIYTLKTIGVLLCLCMLSVHAHSVEALNNFQRLVAKDAGLSATEKERWGGAVAAAFKTKHVTFDYARLVYGILSQAKFDEVALDIAVRVALNSCDAVEKGAPENAVSELVVFAFAENLSVEEIKLYAEVSAKCNAAHVAVHVTQEMIRTAKSQGWPSHTFIILMDGLILAAEHGADTEKIALFMLISVEQKLGSPKKIVADAIENSKQREPEKWQKKISNKKVVPQEEQIPSIPKVVLDYDTFHRSVTSFIGTPYLWGGNNRRGVDCSGFTRLVMEENGYRIPRVSRDQAKIGENVNKKELMLGDLVFFDTKGAGKITHVGLYLGGNLLAHASSSKGVTIVLFSTNYFQSRYVCSRRIIKYQK